VIISFITGLSVDDLTGPAGSPFLFVRIEFSDVPADFFKGFHLARVSTVNLCGLKNRKLYTYCYWQIKERYECRDELLKAK